MVVTAGIVTSVSIFVFSRSGAMRAGLFAAVVAFLAFAGLGSQSAEAAYIAHVDSTANASFSDRSFAEFGSSDSAGRQGVEQLLRLLWEQAFGQAPDDEGTTAPTSSVSGGPALAAVLDGVENVSRAQMVQHLGSSEKVWLPPAFLSGIFRPPRFAD